MKKLYFLLLLVYVNVFAKPIAETTSVVGPAIGVKLISYTGSVVLNFQINIKNTGDQRLTNIYVENVNVGYPEIIFQNIEPQISLEPGEENTLNFTGFKPTTFGACMDLSFIKVYATTPENAIITDYSSPNDYYTDNQTPTPVFYSLFFTVGNTYKDDNNNGVIDLGDTVRYTYSATYYDLQSQSVPFTLTDPNVEISNPTGNSQVPNWSSTGVHDITQNEINVGYVFSSPILNFENNCISPQLQLQNPCYDCPMPNNCFNCIITPLTLLQPNRISGNVRFKTSGNTNCNAGLDFPLRKIATTDGSNTYESFTDYTGNYHISIPNTGTFTTSALNNLGSNFSSDPTAVNTNSSGSATQYTNTNFCISSATNYSDVNVKILPLATARPGFETSYRIVFQNYGSTSLNGNINLAFDAAKMAFISATQSPDNANSGTLLWNYTDLLPFQESYIDLKFNVFPPPAVNQDDSNTLTLTANPIAGDATPENNTAIFNQVIVSSFDPNDKTVLEGAYINATQASDYLTYITRFQNTGNAPASFVIVKEMLDADLDWSTFEPVGASQNYSVLLKNGNELTTSFLNIYLPDSTSNEPYSHGWFAYRIKPKTGFAVGDVASSNAAIYFDFNPAVITNTVSTQISVLGLTKANDNTVKFYPNPASDRIYFSGSDLKNKNYKISDVSGKIINTGKIVDGFIAVDQLEKGIYFLKVEDHQTAKVIIE
ncbi:hypothetical protein FNO01nite_27240 [Flavobacterium noncentrifugens]|uniref:Conserved repeat domain-containing protein/Por secretion system C-terminal sorting domain-containing protein n=1 Tax=Flavobacterium noncentrifugens TaxID=1128970 RepID=A0A1G9CIW1_9FLAO|nr:T9SS type A sorting domain-containing protein [Flavobacterium noncentrifugens]GEP52052.1 hypothetical protein FNO01nite_27240 [Flavobacterium noncentrifugens]SDK51582.1 conserved repeat domain-containing protein/Por secretion system C-terminal sorting domain-containing protein [Flavobacterium noncentrifugens]